VAVRVVDRLEVVEVKEERSDALVALHERALEAFPEQHAIGEAGQRVVECAVLQLLLETLAMAKGRAQVAHDAAEPRDHEQEEHHAAGGDDRHVDRTAGDRLDDQHRRRHQ
jgi:hypothetical protein